MIGSIVHVIENLDDTYGGPARSVPNLAAGSREHGWDVRLMSVQWMTAEHNDVIQRESLAWNRYALLGPRKICLSPGFVRALDREANREGVLIHVHTLWNAVSLAAFALARKHNVPLVVSPRGALYPWSLAQGRTRKALAWRAFVKAAMQRAAFVHVTEPNEAEVVRRLGIRTPLIIVPNGVEEIDPVVLQAQSVEREGRRGNQRRFLFLSRIHAKKGLDFLLKAWSRSKARTRGGRLDIAGPFATPAYQREIEALVSELGIGETVRFLGMLRAEEREQAFFDADVFVLPSHTENFGVAVVEALARGLPVITTTGTPWQSIDECGAGWWINLSVEELVRVLDEVSELPRNALLRRGAQAVALARRFGWKSQVAQLVEAYGWALGGPRPASLETAERRPAF